MSQIITKVVVVVSLIHIVILINIVEFQSLNFFVLIKIILVLSFLHLTIPSHRLLIRRACR